MHPKRILSKPFTLQQSLSDENEMIKKPNHVILKRKLYIFWILGLICFLTLLFLKYGLRSNYNSSKEYQEIENNIKYKFLPDDEDQEETKIHKRSKKYGTEWLNISNICIKDQQIIVYSNDKKSVEIGGRANESGIWTIEKPPFPSTIRSSFQNPLLFILHWDFNYGYLIKENLIPMCFYLNFTNQSFGDYFADVLFVVSDRGSIKEYTNYFLSLFSKKTMIIGVNDESHPIASQQYCFNSIPMLVSRYLPNFPSEYNPILRDCFDFLANESHKQTNSGILMSSIEIEAKRRLQAMFIMRSDTRSITNFDQLSQLLQSKSIRVNSAKLELYSHSQQIRMIRASSILIGMHGAGISNAVFLPKGAALIQFLPNYMGNEFNQQKGPNYGKLAQSIGVYYFEWRDKYYMEVGETESQNYKIQSITVDLIEFEKIIDEILTVGINKILYEKQLEEIE